MAVTDPDYEAFLAWELKARDAVEKRYPKLTLIKEAQEEWDRKTRHRQYARALEVLQKSLQDAEDRDKEIHVVRKKRGHAALTPLEAQRTRQRTLVAARKEWRRVRRNLRDLEVEQAEQDAHRQVIACERSLRYTAQLANEAEHKVAQYENDIDECRAARETFGSTLSLTKAPEDSESEESELDANDERDGRSTDDGAEGSDAGDRNGDDESSKEDWEGDQDEADNEEHQGRSKGGRGDPGDAPGDDDPGDESSTNDGEPSDDGSEYANSSDEDSADENEREVGEGEEDEGSADHPEGLKSSGSQSPQDKQDSGGKTTKRPHRVPTKHVGIGGPQLARKRKSSDDQDRKQKPATKRKASVKPQQLRSTSGASKPSRADTSSSDEDTPSEPLSDESSEEDEERLSDEAFLTRWRALETLAQKTRKVDAKWSKDFAKHRRAAWTILRSEGWAIFPDNFMKVTDLQTILDELGAKIAVAQEKMAHRRDRRKRHPPDISGLTYKIGFGGARGELPVEGDFVYYDTTAGKGSFGHNTIWLRHDADGNIVERVVVKDLRPQEDEWNIDQNFYGEGQARTPREAHMHELASNRDPDAMCIVRFRGKAFFSKKHLLRIYMEYCPYGDFFDAWERHLDTVEGEVRSDYFVCAPVIWALFEALATAAHIMAFGTAPGGEAPANWERMLHRDIKPENVFLSEPSETRWLGIPLMKLGDFGLAALEGETWSQAQGLGTRDFMPPEVRGHGGTLTEGRISSPAADVGSIGMVMVDLMSGVREDIEHGYTLDMDESRLPRIDEMGQRFYPKELVELVHRCVRRLPHDRIAIAELCNRIDDEVKDLCKTELSEEDKAKFMFEGDGSKKMAG